MVIFRSSLVIGNIDWVHCPHYMPSEHNRRRPVYGIYMRLLIEFPWQDQVSWAFHRMDPIDWITYNYQIHDRLYIHEIKKTNKTIQHKYVWRWVD
jgi:hypothetical protein